MKKTLRTNLTLFMSLLLIMTVLFSVPVSADVTEHVILEDFDTPFDPEKPEWTVSSPDVVDMITPETEGDNGYIKLDLSDADATTAKAAALVQKIEGTGNVKINVNTSYKLSFKAKADKAVSPYVYIRLKNTDNQSMEFYLNFEEEVCAVGSWTEFTAYFVTEKEEWAADAEVSLLEIKLKTPASSPTTPICYDDISIVEGVAPVVHKDYIINGDFDTDPTNDGTWYKSSDAIASFLSWDETGGKNGGGAIKLDFSTADDSVTGPGDAGKPYRNATWAQKLIASSGNALSLSTVYRVTFDAKSTIPFTPKVTIVPKVDGDSKTGVVYNAFAESAANAWTTYSFSFLPYDSGDILNQLEIKFSYGTATKAPVWYDNISIVEDYNECTFGDKDGNIVNSIPADGKMTVKCHRVNNTDADTTAALYFAVYEIQGNAKILKDIGITGTKTIAKHTAEDLESSITISDYSEDKSYSIKAFLWSEAGSLVPIDAAASFPNEA